MGVGWRERERKGDGERGRGVDSLVGRIVSNGCVVGCARAVTRVREGRDSNMRARARDEIRDEMGVEVEVAQSKRPNEGEEKPGGYDVTSVPEYIPSRRADVSVRWSCREGERDGVES